MDALADAHLTVLDDEPAAVEVVEAVRFRAEGAAAVLRRNLLIYGLGGLLTPFLGIKVIDVVITAMGVK